ncbi:FAD-binding protein [Actinophytocola sp.]|uniref:FAD-binding protein n=1 Tax=Actinophytocola sp. TaxID=1872138 RepID=UPI003D6B6F14
MSVVDFDETFDVVVLGSGASGTAAAATAAAHGATVLLAEKADVLGGGTAYSYGAIWLGVDPFGPSPQAPPAQELADAVDYLRFLTADTASVAELQRFIRRSSWAMRSLRSLGVPFKTLQRVPDHYFPMAPGSRPKGRVFATELFRAADLGEWAPHLGRSPYVPTGVDWDEAIGWGGLTDQTGWDHELVASRRADGDHRGFGMGLAGHLLAACLRHRVDVRTACAGHRLILDDGAVAGVELVARRGEELVTLRVGAKRGVVLACGGAEGDTELVRKFEDLPAWRTHFPPSVEGDGIRMALEIGAALARARHNLRVMLGYQLDVPEGGRHFRSSGVREAAAPHTVIVNARGERFGDESSFQFMVNEVKRFDVRTHTYVNYPCFLIMDAQFFERYSFAGRPVGEPAPAWLARGGDLRELAGKLSIDAAGLERTVEAFNAGVAAGADVFGRGSTPFANIMGGTAQAGSSANLGPLTRPPYYGVALVPTGISSITLEVDAGGQVRDVRGRPVPGLFACGNNASDIDTGPGYQAGLSHAQGMAMGVTIGTAVAGAPVP